MAKTVVRITKQIISQLIDHAKNDLPIEACGYLGEKNGIVSRQFKMVNIDKSSTHYSFDPQEQFKVIKKMRNNGIKATIVYHSHPETPARMSHEDLKLAHDTSLDYLIISLKKQRPIIKLFSVENGKAREKGIEIVDD